MFILQWFNSPIELRVWSFVALYVIFGLFGAFVARHFERKRHEEIVDDLETEINVLKDDYFDLLDYHKRQMSGLSDPHHKNDELIKILYDNPSAMMKYCCKEDAEFVKGLILSLKTDDPFFDPIDEGFISLAEICEINNMAYRTTFFSVKWDLNKLNEDNLTVEVEDEEAPFPRYILRWPEHEPVIEEDEEESEE